MFYRSKKGWEIPENQATDHGVYLNRRKLLAGLGAGLLSLSGCDSSADTADDKTTENRNNDIQTDKLFELTKSLYPSKRNELYKVEERPLTEREYTIGYNNYYEFGSNKYIWQAAQSLRTHPWEIVIDGEVEKPLKLEFTDLLKKMPLEQRVYRHRCVEAWAMTVPWEGFALRHLVKLANPLSSAKYLRMETLADKETMPGLKQFWYPWPYVEGLTIEEANNDLAFMATGLYGLPMPKQNGAPLRLAVPWKYGFKSLKSIVRFTFTSEQPVSFWQGLQGKEYGFWANVNPKFKHPRWSQATERLLGEDRRVPTQLYNGYGEFVSDLYAGFDTSNRNLFY